jgi:hypothetical protein
MHNTICQLFEDWKCFHPTPDKLQLTCVVLLVMYVPAISHQVVNRLSEIGVVGLWLFCWLINVIAFGVPNSPWSVNMSWRWLVPKLLVFPVPISSLSLLWTITSSTELVLLRLSLFEHNRPWLLQSLPSYITATIYTTMARSLAQNTFPGLRSMLLCLSTITAFHCRNEIMIQLDNQRAKLAEFKARFPKAMIALPLTTHSLLLLCLDIVSFNEEVSEYYNELVIAVAFLTLFAFFVVVSINFDDWVLTVAAVATLLDIAKTGFQCDNITLDMQVSAALGIVSIVMTFCVLSHYAVSVCFSLQKRVVITQ